MADDFLLQFIRHGENSDGHCGCDSCPEDLINLMGVFREKNALKQRSSSNVKRIYDRRAYNIYLSVCR